MTLKKGAKFLVDGHGTGAGVPRVQVPAHDELPSPAADPRPVLSGSKGRCKGKFSEPETARKNGAKGGKTTAKNIRLARSLGLPVDSETPAFRPYKSAASAFRRHHVSELAKISGGEVGAGPASMIASASLQLAASRFCFDLGANTGDPATLKTASQLANDSRQNILAAYSLAQQEAAARPKQNPTLALIERMRAESQK